MSFMLQHLNNGWQVDQAILSEEDRIVLIRLFFLQHKIRLLCLTSDNRFGHDWDPTCMKMDETLYSIAEKCKNFVVIYLVDITEVPDFNKMYELYDPCTIMFFFRLVQSFGAVCLESVSSMCFRNKHIMIDLGTGNNNKINWAMEDKQEMIDIVETIYRFGFEIRV